MTRAARAVLWLTAIGGVVALAVPRLTYSCVANQEPGAKWALRDIALQQDEFRRAARVDVDCDGRGEFGTIAEMGAAVALAGRDAALPSPMLSGAFRTVRADGTASRSGYRFRVFLPDAQGDGTRETGTPPVAARAPGGGCCDPSPPHAPRPAVGSSNRSDRVDAGLAAQRWCGYAWPDEYGRAGRRTFFVDHDGNEFCVDDPRYSGDAGPPAGAAFAGGGITSMLGTIPDAGGVSQDGNVWRPTRRR